MYSATYPETCLLAPKDVTRMFFISFNAAFAWIMLLRPNCLLYLLLSLTQDNLIPRLA